ncbi:hypothetical protein ABK040_003376 [Willaertia magna]
MQEMEDDDDFFNNASRSIDGIYRRRVIELEEKNKQLEKTNKQLTTQLLNYKTRVAELERENKSLKLKQVNNQDPYKRTFIKPPSSNSENYYNDDNDSDNHIFTNNNNNNNSTITSTDHDLFISGKGTFDSPITLSPLSKPSSSSSSNSSSSRLNHSLVNNEERIVKKEKVSLPTASRLIHKSRITSSSNNSNNNGSSIIGGSSSSNNLTKLRQPIKARRIVGSSSNTPTTNTTPTTTTNSNNTIRSSTMNNNRINNDNTVNSLTDDEEFARKLQEEEYARTYGAIDFDEGADLERIFNNNNSLLQHQPYRAPPLPMFTQMLRQHQQQLNTNGQVQPIGDTYEDLLRLDEQNVKVGVDQNLLLQLPVYRFKGKDTKMKEEDHQCCICMCDYEIGNELRRLPCFHEFHKDCVDTWLENNHVCPVCKFDLNEN